MIKYNDYCDIMIDLELSEIFSDEHYHWWTGCIDGCYLASIIDSDERNDLLERLEEIIEQV